MIEVRNLWKRYRNAQEKKWVLTDLNFTIPEGRSVGIIGSNGAGKSTLLRLIGGMDNPDRGYVKRNCKVSWPIGLSGGFQTAMTGRQNTKFVARIHGNDNSIGDIISKVENFAEIGNAFDKPVGTYSMGMRSRLAFGLSLAFDFDVYLSDEATAVGDASFKRKAINAFKDKVNQKSLIMVSHQEGILRELCQSGIYLSGGKACWYESIDEALLEYNRKRKENEQ